MFGKPMVSCEIGTGTSFININQETGCVVPPEDSNALAEAMNAYLAHPTKAVRDGRNARHRYQKCLTASEMARRYCLLYNDLKKESVRPGV